MLILIMGRVLRGRSRNHRSIRRRATSPGSSGTGEARRRGAAGAAAKSVRRTPRRNIVPHLAYCYPGRKVAIETRDRKGGRRGRRNWASRRPRKTVAMKPDNAEYYRRASAPSTGQAVTDIMSGLSYGPKAKDAINKARGGRRRKSSMMYVGARGR